MSIDIFPDIKMPRKKRKDSGIKREKYSQPEKELRKQVVKYLRSKSIIVMRLENSICGKHNIGIPDLLVFNLKKDLFCFVELKSDVGVLSSEQRDFADYCTKCGVRYLVCRKIDELKEIL